MRDSSSSASDEADDDDLSLEAESSVQEEHIEGHIQKDLRNETQEDIQEDLLDLPFATALSVSGESYTENIKSLSQNFQNLIAKMSDRIIALSDQANASVQQTYQNLERHDFKDSEQLVAGLRSLMKECDSLEAEFAKIRYIGEIAAGFSQRISKLEKQFDTLRKNKNVNKSRLGLV